MDLRYLKRVLELFDESQATEISIEEESFKIKLSKHNKDSRAPLAQTFAAQQPLPQPVEQQPQAKPEPVLEEKEPETLKEEEASTAGLQEVTSPIVGTFYRAPSPESDPFVEVGTHVQPGTTLCIVEAMKLMNEIESDVSGVVEKILIKNAEPVEYGQAMFMIRPD